MIGQGVRQTASTEWQSSSLADLTDISPGIPAGTANLGGIPLRWAIATSYFLISKYAFWTMQIGEKIVYGRATRLRQSCHGMSEALRKHLEKRTSTQSLYLVLRKVAMAWRYFTFSAFTELLDVLAWFAANCYFVAGNRALGEWVYGTSSRGRQERATEDDMGFGQIVPLFLLMLPAMTFISTWHGRLCQN